MNDGGLYQAEKVETPHGIVTPGVMDVAKSGRFFDGRDAFRRIVSKETLDNL